LLLFVCVLLSTGCGGKEQKQSNAVQYHQVKGQVVALDPSLKRVTIAHEDIPGYMKAMTMPFAVRDSSLLRGVEVGDSVLAVLALRPEATIDSLTIVWKMASSESQR
jgi:protein SCO1/2